MTDKLIEQIKAELVAAYDDFRDDQTNIGLGPLDEVIEEDRTDDAKAALDKVRQEARDEALRETAALIGVRVGHGGYIQDCQCGMCLARRSDYDAILALIEGETNDQ